MNLDTFFCMFNRGYDCAMIGHTQLFLWSRYSDIISLLTITVRGYQISIAYCLFSFELNSYVFLPNAGAEGGYGTINPIVRST